MRKGACGGQVITKTREAVVWHRQGVIHGCHRSVGRARSLGILWGGLTPVHLQGRYLAYAELVEDTMDLFFGRLHVYDLVAGRTKARTFGSPITASAT